MNWINWIHGAAFTQGDTSAENYSDLIGSVKTLILFCQYFWHKVRNYSFIWAQILSTERLWAWARNWWHHHSIGLINAYFRWKVCEFPFCIEAKSTCIYILRFFSTGLQARRKENNSWHLVFYFHLVSKNSTECQATLAWPIKDEPEKCLQVGVGVEVKYFFRSN